MTESRSDRTRYRTGQGFACECNDATGQLDWRSLAADALDVDGFFGTVALANYLFGLARLAVPGRAHEFADDAPGRRT